MDQHTLAKLEYDEVRGQLREFAACGLGIAEIDRLQPSTDPKWIAEALAEVTEVRYVSDSRGHLPLGGVHDIRHLLEKAAVAALLQPDELLDLGGTLASARRLRAFLQKDPEKAPRLSRWAGKIGVFEKVEEEIQRCIGDKGEVLDRASPQLASIRGRVRTLQSRITEKLNTLLRTHKALIQEPVITLRDDRYCIPVKSEHRREFGGLVHDQSASGATVFMEPQAVVEMGNELRELQIKERHEIERILRLLTDRVAAHSAEMVTTVQALAHLDLVSAKGRWADARRCIEPELDSHGRLTLYGGRHPLLRGEVVPTDVRLGDEFDALLITGPNTGGKTVCLKTVGLLCLLAQSGLHIPADPGTRLPVFRKVFADIGDEQSIQQSLSTFSSHIRQISRIVSQADSSSLVLLDEIGAGTDPQEGAALAKAILAYLLQRGAKVMASTHYGELKEYAMTTPRMENASVEFDHETLSPTYRLLVGVPGSSNALSIASRLGLPEEIVEGARKAVDPERRSLEEAYRRMEESRRSAEKAETTARASLAEVERLKQDYQREYQSLRSRRDETSRKAAEQARQLLRQTQEEARQILDELRKAGLEGRQTEQARQRLVHLRQRVEAQTQEASAAQPKAPDGLRGTRDAQPQIPPSYRQEEGEPVAGDEVLISSFGRSGVLRRRSGDNAEVQIGAMRMTVPFASLRKLTKAASRPRAESVGGGAVALQTAATIPSELHLRGLRADEALLAIDEYLDQARLAGLKSVRVVHGKGTGVLRKVLWDRLREDPTVKGFTHPSEEEGGAGATVVEFHD